jgi:5-methyltetrahydrofolate--homocysteine methyltransferase
MTTLEQLSQAVSAGKSKDAKALTQLALDEGVRPGDIVDRALVPAMASVGDKFKQNLIFVPEMLIAARAMKEAMLLLEPRLVAAGITPKFTAVLGTAQGDLHDIGKNLVAVMWKGANFKVVDLGTNVAPAKFVAAVQEHKPQLVGLSALLTTTMPAMIETVRAIRAGGCPPVKIMIGGAPISQQFADEIGADGYAPDAGSAVDRARELVGAA